MADEIPKRIREMMDSDERACMRQRKGWATGTVVEVNEGGEEVRRLDGAWIELFNGHGLSGVFGGIRFMWADDDEEWPIE